MKTFDENYKLLKDMYQDEYFPGTKCYRLSGIGRT